VINHFIDARDLKLMTDDEFIRAEHTARRAIKAASGLIRYLESTPDPPPPPYLPKAKLEDPEWGQDEKVPRVPRVPRVPKGWCRALAPALAPGTGTGHQPVGTLGTVWHLWHRDDTLNLTLVSN
jgi:hypothetical protein